ncbi:testis-expressed protein 43 [Bombina bombina]|uniref:testis-expressed protein 43 n=1 Tax=Bombina bombina TaxID=8345 RepID=UPI00235B1527|nr:testis-expressed protein 43 [Bombina bombina]
MKDQMEMIGANEGPAATRSVATITDIKGLANSHVPEFSKRHPLIPKRYVMPWKQDMVNRKLITKYADLVGIYKGPHEESLFLENKERICHEEEFKVIKEKIKDLSLMENTDFPMHSPLYKYKSYIRRHHSKNLSLLS